MGDHDDGFPLSQCCKRRLYLGLIVRVGKGGGLVQNQHRCVLQNSTGNGDPLLLAAGKVHALAANDSVDTLWELFNNIHALGSFQCGKDFFLGGIRPAKPNIVQNSTLEKFTVLEHESHRIHQFFLGNRPHIRTADGYAAALHIEESADETCQCGFAAAGGSHQRHSLSGLNVHGDAFDHLRLAIIAEMHIPQGDRAVLRVLGLPKRRYRLCVQHGVNTTQRVRNDHFVLAHVHDLRQRQGDHRRDDDIEQ